MSPDAAAVGVHEELRAAAGGLRERLADNTRHCRERMTKAGVDLKPGVHPVVPVMIHDAPCSASKSSLRKSQVPVQPGGDRPSCE